MIAMIMMTGHRTMQVADKVAFGCVARERTPPTLICFLKKKKTHPPAPAHVRMCNVVHVCPNNDLVLNLSWKEHWRIVPARGNLAVMVAVGVAMGFLLWVKRRYGSYYLL
eukprot:Rmarinus@m.29270